MTDRLSELERLHAAAKEAAATSTYELDMLEDRLTLRGAAIPYVAEAANFTPVAIRMIRRLVEALDELTTHVADRACTCDIDPDGGVSCPIRVACAALSEVKKELNL